MKKSDMVTIFKKGLDILELKDGTKDYKPFAYLSNNKNNKLYIKPFNGLYYLNENGFVTRTNEKDAIALLEEACNRFIKEETRKYNSQVVKTTEKFI